MRQSFPILHIPKPCAKHWPQMTPQAAGRHCAGCRKVVIDFTRKTDAEIRAVRRTTGSVCRRFEASQLAQPLTGEVNVTNTHAPVYMLRGAWGRLRSIPSRVGNMFR